MNINKRIKELQEEISDLKDSQHNFGMLGVSKDIQKRLIENQTESEKKFYSIAKRYNLNIYPQQKVEIYSKNRIKKFYFPDFIDRRNKLIFEIDGGYHDNDKQKIKDAKRTKDLNKLGYKVYRITNEEIELGGTSAFLYKIYKSIGIDILE